MPPRAQACPECGADHNSGWKEDSSDGLDLPDEEFNYEEFVEREFGGGLERPAINRIWWATAVILLAAFAVWFLSSVI